MIQASELHGNPAINLLPASQLCFGGEGWRLQRISFLQTSLSCDHYFDAPPPPRIVLSRETQCLFQAPTMCQVLAREPS